MAELLATPWLCSPGILRYEEKLPLYANSRFQTFYSGTTEGCGGTSWVPRSTAGCCCAGACCSGKCWFLRGNRACMFQSITLLPHHITGEHLKHAFVCQDSKVRWRSDRDLTVTLLSTITSNKTDGPLEQNGRTALDTLPDHSVTLSWGDTITSGICLFYLKATSMTETYPPVGVPQKKGKTSKS